MMKMRIDTIAIGGTEIGTGDISMPRGVGGITPMDIAMAVSRAIRMKNMVVMANVTTAAEGAIGSPDAHFRCCKKTQTLTDYC